MKIVLINTFFAPDIVGGAEVIVQEQAQALTARGFEVFVVCLGKVNAVLEETVSGIKVYRIPYSNRFLACEWYNYGKIDNVLWHLKDIYNKDIERYLYGIITKEKPQLAICHNLAGLSVSVWGVLHDAGVKILQYIHDQYFVCLKSTSFDGNGYCEKPCLKCSLIKSKARRMSSCVDGVVAVSNYVAGRLQRLGYFGDVPSRVIHNARKLPWCSKPQKSACGLVIGYIGAINWVKGVHVLLKAFIDSGVEARLLIAGRCEDSNYESELKSICSDSGKVEFLGFMNSAEFYERIDCLVVPSLWPDTFPTVAFESCAAGVPVIASDIGGLPEIVKDGINGFLFTPGDNLQLASLLGRIATDRTILENLSVNCRDSVAEMTDTDLMYNKLIDFINDIC